MKKIVSALALTAVVALMSGCASKKSGASADAGALPAGDPGAVNMPVENYDKGRYPYNPFLYWGELSERSGYPYQGVRIGCDLFYTPSINYCKYFDHPERLIRIDRVYETDAQQFTDDYDLFWMNDRPSYLSRFTVR